VRFGGDAARTLAGLANEVAMQTNVSFPGDSAAERIVRHFQSEGFIGISEALIIRIGVRAGTRADIETAFEQALAEEKVPPVHQHFEIRPFGFFSERRDFSAARAAIQGDLSSAMRMEIPRIYFDPAPVMVDDPFATGTRYDAMLKLRGNVGTYAFAILLNDPDSSFMEYLGTHYGYDWQKIMGSFEEAVSQCYEGDLI
jgi:hypothetical protein